MNLPPGFLPPFMSLPPELRERIKARLQTEDAILPEDVVGDDPERALAALSVWRLVGYFGGDISAARAYSRAHSKDDYPSCVIGSRKKDWQAALKQFQAHRERIASSPKAAVSTKIFLEEIGAWELEHGKL